MKALVISIIILWSTLQCMGQGGYIPPKVPEKYCKELANAKLNADAGYSQQSVEEIKGLIDKYPTWTEAYQQLSRIYYQAGMKQEAIEAMEASLAIDTLSQLAQLYTLGKLYEENGDVYKAKLAYAALLKKNNVPSDVYNRAIVSMEDLEMKLELWESDYTIEISPLPQGINSGNHEFLGRWTLDGRSIIFTRNLGGQEDLFMADFNLSGELLKVSSMPFNTEQHEGAYAISPDGKYLIFSSDRREGMGSQDLYLAVLKDSIWQAPVNMGPAFNTPGWDAQPCFGLDGKSLYFSSSRAGGAGGRDIWMVHEMTSGKWSKPVNAGPAINTAANEESPYIHFDGRTMYFMRDGKEGIGGFDLYFAKKGIDGKWQFGENMKAPINSSSDEGALSLHPDGKHAVITRYTQGSKNDLFTFELPAQFQSSPVQALMVHVKDANTSLPVRARLEIIDVNGQDTVRVSQWADEKGDITATLERNKPYGLISSADHYLMQSFHLPADTGAVVNLNVNMIPIALATNTTVVLNNIFFETGSAKLLKASDTELRKLLLTMRENTKMKIEIRGHTDHVGSDADNQVLSEARAKAVYQHLIDRGIDSSRLSYKGYGETLPIASNGSESGRRQNRRTEFLILAN